MKALVILILSSSLIAQVKPFKYTLADYPKTVENCHKQATKVAEEFSSATGLKVINSICTKEALNRCNIEIIYEAEEPVKRVSTAVTGSVSNGRYRDLKECEANISREVFLFEEKTALKAIFFYCVRDDLGDKYPWFPAIESFGEALQYPFASSFYLFTVPQSISYKEYKAGIESALANNEATLIEFIINSYLAYGIATVHYYSAKRLPFLLKEYTKTDTLEQCEEQKREIPSIFENISNKPAAVYCGRIAVGMGWELTILTIGKESLWLRYSLETFPKFLECEEKRREVIYYYKETLKGDVRGGLCSRIDNQEYKVALFKPILGD